MKNILVIGGLGYLGGRIVKHLCDHSYKVYITTRKQSCDYPDNVPTNCEVITTDYSSYSDLNKLMNGIDCVIHLAGPDAHTPFNNANELIKSHIDLTERLVTISSQNSVSKFIYFSTIHVYGNNLKGIVSEETEPDPQYPFSKSHFEAEKIILPENCDMNKIILRCGNVYGAPYFKNEKCWNLAVNQFYKNAIEKGVIIVNSPNVHRSFMSLNQSCNVIEELVLNDSYEGIYNVGEKESISMLDMAKRVQLSLNNNSDASCKIDTPKDLPSISEKSFIFNSIFNNTSLNKMIQKNQIDIRDFGHN